MSAMNAVGCDYSQISGRKFKTIETANALSILSALEQSGIQFSGKYNDEKLILIYSSSDEDKVDNIINHSSELDTEQPIQERKTENSENYKALLPEIAEMLNMSVSALEKRPSDVQMMLAQIYTANSSADSATIREALGQVVELNTATRDAIAREREQQLSHQNTLESQREAELQKETAEQERIRSDAANDSVCIHPNIPATAERPQKGYITRQQRNRMAQELRSKQKQTEVHEHSPEERERKNEE